MQSADYVPGVSGWKIDTATGEFEAHSKSVSVSGVDPDARYCGRSRQVETEPFIAHEGKVCISQTMTSQFVIDPGRWSVKLERNGNGQYVAAGIGLGVSEFEQARAKGARAVLDFISGSIERSDLAQSLLDEIERHERRQHEAIREVIRKENQPGGMLYRR
jgi:hypothetical protein